MHLGEMKFKKKSGKDDQAMHDGTEAAGNVAKLLGNSYSRKMILSNDFYSTTRMSINVHMC